MNGYDVDEFQCETLLLAKTPEARQHFFLFNGFPGIIGCVSKWQVFFKKFSDTDLKLAWFPHSLATSRGFTF
jgi:hypothetical protein